MRELIVDELGKYSSKEKASVLQRFFKTGKGQYGDGDIFIGVKVPEIRCVVKEYYKGISNEDIDYFLYSEIHEYRLFALLCLVMRFEKSKNDNEKKEIYSYYLDNTVYINNWDLVDLSCSRIVGMYLLDKSFKPLYSLVRSKSMWEQRIGIVSTSVFIKNRRYNEILDFSIELMNTNEDLIQKALGWMLREVGKKDIGVLRDFLNKYANKMPRIMLRYSIEKFDKEERYKYLSM